MDSIFRLGEGDRSAFLARMVRSVGCSYICLWSVLRPPSNCLLCFDGVHEEHLSSSESLARRLFNVYRESENSVDNGRVPGYAFKNKLDYMVLKRHELQIMKSSEAQLHFYEEAGIQTVVFMGCASGEVELGMNHESTMDLEMEIKNMLYQTAATFSQSADQNPLSSSLSSFESNECPPLRFSVPTSSLVQEQSPHRQQDLARIRNFSTAEDAAMTKAILAVLSSEENAPNFPSISPSDKPTSFQRYRPAASATIGRIHKQNMFKRAVLFFRNLNSSGREEMQIQENRSTATQVHHMISERKRREKLNESIQVLRSLLPSGSKKDKASVLSSATEYLRSLKCQVEELSRRNKALEEQLSGTKGADGEGGNGSLSGQERLHVEMAHLSEPSTAESKVLDLRVNIRENCSMIESVSKIFEFLKQQNNVTLLSVEGRTRVLEPTPVNALLLLLRLKLDQADEFDESGFQQVLRTISL